MLVKQLEEQKVLGSALVKVHAKERSMPISLIASSALQESDHVEDKKDVKDKNK
jgi:hypothetical protein